MTEAIRAASLTRPTSPTKSTYQRGLDHLINTYNYLDLTPLGRNEQELQWAMAWVRYHDKYSA